MTRREWPKVSVIVPVRDEADHLPQAVASILSQGYPGEFQIVLAVAPSEDRTEQVAAELAERDRRVVVVENPQGTTPAGLNRAIEAADGEVIVRVDGHSQLSPRYIATAVETLEETGAWNVGGIQRAVGDTPMQSAIAAAMSSRFGTGDARFHYGGDPGPADTVYLGVWPREVLMGFGGFDEYLFRNQDYELNVRIREAGGLVWFNPRLEVTYRPRSSLRDLASQYWQYGHWKRVVLHRHPGSLRWRQAVPPVTVIANLLGVVGAAISPWMLIVPGAYVGSTLIASAIVARRDASALVRLPIVFATMHHAWGAGFLLARASPHDPDLPDGSKPVR